MLLWSAKDYDRHVGRPMYSHISNALKRVTAALKGRYPEDVIELYAFGSQARGDHSDKSDLDVLVVVKDRSPAIEEVVIDAFVEEEIKTGLSFDPVIKGVASMELEERHNTPFFENLRREGIHL